MMVSKSELKCGDTVYSLVLNERDDHFYSHDTFSCEITRIEDVVKCHKFSKEGERILYDYTYFKYKISNHSELLELNNEMLFASAGAVIQYLLGNFINVYEDKYYIYLLHTDDYDTICCLVKPTQFSYTHIDLATMYMKETENEKK